MGIFFGCFLSQAREHIEALHRKKIKHFQLTAELRASAQVEKDEELISDVALWKQLRHCKRSSSEPYSKRYDQITEVYHATTINLST